MVKKEKIDSGVRAQIKEFGLKAQDNKSKNFILDTNVLLHDPACLSRFSDNHICITTDVLSELDKFKGEKGLKRMEVVLLGW